MASHNGTFVVLQAGEEFPEALLKHIQKFTQPNGFGAAFVMEGEPGITFQAGGTDINSILPMRESFKEVSMVICLMQYPGDMHEDDLQPYVIAATEDGHVDLMAFIIGEVRDDLKPTVATTRTDQYHALINVVQPRIDKLLKIAKNDIATVIEAINDDAGIATEFSEMFKDNGSLILIASTGDMLNFGANATDDYVFSSLEDKRVVFNAHGYMEGEYPSATAGDVEPPTPAPKSAAERLREALQAQRPQEKTIKPVETKEVKPVEKAVKPVTVEPPEKIIKPVEEKTEAKTVPAIALSQPKEEDKKATMLQSAAAGPLLARPPSHLSSHNKLKRWYEENSSVGVPKNYKERPEVPIVREKRQSVLKELGLKAIGVITQTKAEQKAEEFKKDTDGKVVQVETKPVLGTVPPAELKNFQKEFMSHPDITHPPSLTDVLKEMDKKVPVFSEHTGVNLEETEVWRYERRLDLAFKDPVLSTSLQIAYLRAMLKYREELERYGKIFSEAQAKIAEGTKKA